MPVYFMSWKSLGFVCSMYNINSRCLFSNFHLISQVFMENKHSLYRSMVNEMALICCNRVIKNLDDSALFCINCEDKTTFLFGQTS